jgi:dihydrofolate reductase
MRKIVASLFVSLDGVVEAPEEWTFPYFNDEVGQAVGESFAASDALLMGRVNYEDWAAVWPGREGPLADTINTIRKYVVTTTLQSADWTNSTVVTGDVAAQIRALKDEPGKDIAMSGSATLAEWLLHEGLLDELRLLLYPIVVGTGRRLFTDGTPRQGMELVTSKTYSSGVVDLTYRPATG